MLASFFKKSKISQHQIRLTPFSVSDIINIPRKFITLTGELGTNIGEFVNNSVFLIYGSPGSGKTTLALDIAKHLGKQGYVILYNASGGIFTQKLTDILIKLDMIEVDNKINIINVHDLYTITQSVVNVDVIILDTWDHLGYNYAEFLDFKKLMNNKLLIIVCHGDDKMPLRLETRDMLFDSEVKILCESGIGTVDNCYSDIHTNVVIFNDLNKKSIGF